MIVVLALIAPIGAITLRGRLSAPARVAQGGMIELVPVVSVDGDHLEWWEVLLGADRRAVGTPQRAGWRVSGDARPGRLVVTAPHDARVAAGYIVRCRVPNGVASATFDVVPGVRDILPALAAVPAGRSARVTVTLGAPAPPSGLAVALLSSNPTVVSVPASITIPGGRDSAAVDVKVSATRSTCSSEITAEHMGGRATGVLVVNPKLSIANVKDGDALSGDVRLIVRVPTRCYDYGMVKLAIDGAPANVGGKCDPGTTAPTTSIDVATDTYANGPHSLEVTDWLGGRDVRRVRFENPISDVAVDTFFDLFDSQHIGASRVCHIRCRLAPPGPWSVTILSIDAPGEVVRTYSGTGSAICLAWDGRDARGVEVADYAYDVQIRRSSEPPVVVTVNKQGSTYAKGHRGDDQDNKQGHLNPGRPPRPEEEHLSSPVSTWHARIPAP